MVKDNIEKIPLGNNRYPELLREIYDPPANLYIRGNFSESDKLAIGVVGTRTFTSYGKQVTEDIVRDLAKAGITIVSGLAKGIDTFAHQTALRENGRTIAVLGSSIDEQSIYPSSNKDLAKKIIKKGALISEHPVGTKSERWYFAKRNRIISGLSLGVLVVEAPEKSGALITASQALEQNREVFVIPGSIYSRNSKGTNKLIQAGAKLVTSANDILEEFNLPLLENQKIIYKPNKEEEILLKIIDEPTHIDEIIKISKLNASVVNSTLMTLELKGVIRNAGAGYYRLVTSNL